MLHAASLFVGLLIVWLLAAGNSPVASQLWIAAPAALACTFAALRLGGVDPNLTRTPGRVLLWIRQWPLLFSAALKTVRIVFSRNMDLNPALVRVRAVQRVEAALASSPGRIPVEADADGVLVHVLDEDAAEPAAAGVRR
jgi:multisubunit Na+/H+ antiporter MnhE subunit